MSFLKRWKYKREKPLQDPVDLHLVGTDMHSHLIPGIDDGAKDLEESLSLVRSLHEAGYRKMITTPHIFWDLYKNDSATILRGAEILNTAIKKEGLSCEVIPAAEYYLDDHFEKLIEQNDLLSFGDKYILFEISFVAEPPSFKRALFNLRLLGYKPILAHPERYEYWNTHFSKYEELAEQDVHLQLNINSLTGQYGQSVKRTAERMISEGLITFLGTDCHHSGHIDLMKQACLNPQLRALLESGKLLNSTL
jgi:tyrosine-protein phosphatase YwqE